MKIDNKYIHSLRQLAEAMDLITLLICELIKISRLKLCCRLHKLHDNSSGFIGAYFTTLTLSTLKPTVV